MKQLSTIATGLLILLASCRSASYFESPNYLRNIKAMLYLTNGDSLQGKLIVNTENVFGSDVKMYVGDERQPRKFRTTEVKAYRVNQEYYELRQIRGEVSLVRQLSFMHRLTPPGSRIHLFENMEKVQNDRTNGGTSPHRYETQYYMQFPGEDGIGVWAVNSSRLVPNFDEKMSAIVKDCPALAKKIAEKQEGYFVAQVTIFREKRIAVLMNIVTEYNSCR